MRRCLRDPTFSCFDTLPECDRHTDRQTHRHTTTAYTALSIASRGKNDLRCSTGFKVTRREVYSELQYMAMIVPVKKHVLSSLLRPSLAHIGIFPGAIKNINVIVKSVGSKGQR